MEIDAKIIHHLVKHAVRAVTYLEETPQDSGGLITKLYSIIIRMNLIIHVVNLNFKHNMIECYMHKFQLNFL